MYYTNWLNQNQQERARHVRVKARVRLGDENFGWGQGKPKTEAMVFGKVAAAPVADWKIGDQQRLEHLGKLLEKQKYRNFYEGKNTSLKKAWVQIRNVLELLVKKS